MSACAGPALAQATLGTQFGAPNGRVRIARAGGIPAGQSSRSGAMPVTADPAIAAALREAAKRFCICDGECFETRHGMMNGPCEAMLDQAAAADRSST